MINLKIVFYLTTFITSISLPYESSRHILVSRCCPWHNSGPGLDVRHSRVRCCWWELSQGDHTDHTVQPSSAANMTNLMSTELLISYLFQTIYLPKYKTFVYQTKLNNSLFETLVYPNQFWGEIVILAYFLYNPVYYPVFFNWKFWSNWDNLYT